MSKFIERVKDMRRAQKAYFVAAKNKARMQPYELYLLLDESQKCEKAVDDALREWDDRDKPKQSKLFEPA